MLCNVSVKGGSVLLMSFIDKIVRLTYKLVPVIVLGAIQKVNTFMSVQTVHFFKLPSPISLKCTDQHFEVPKQAFHAAQHLLCNDKN